MANTMKAVRYHETGNSKVLKIEQSPVPILMPGKILVRMHFAGLNPIDAAIRAGDHEHLKIQPPVTPGMEGSGFIADIGEHVKGFKKGERVIVYTRQHIQHGTYSQYCLVNPENCFPLPEKYSLQEGAAIPLAFMTAYYAIVIKGQAKEYETVFINGASGSVGLTAIDICKTLELRVIGTAGHREGLDAILRKGVLALNYHDHELKKQIREAVGSDRTVDIILDAKSSHLPVDLTLLAPGGRVLILSKPSKESLDFEKVLMDEITIMGVRVDRVNDATYETMRTALNKALEAGSIHPEIERVFDLTDVAKAHDELLSPSKGRAGKLILNLE